MKLPEGISVVVCCFNSAGRLSETMAHLAAQRVPPSTSWEVIVVDNASTDGTANVATAEWRRHSCGAPFRVVEEPEPGLSAARRKALFEARYEYVLFCDDDNWLAADYVARAFEIMQANPAIGVLGGQSTPGCGEAALPAWFYTFCGSYAVGSQGIQSGDISQRGYVWGAAMIVRARLLRALFDHGYQPILSGRSGGKLRSGDDSEICKWFLLAGYRLWFDETLIFRHFIPEARVTKEYLLAVHQGFAEAAPVLRAYDAFIARSRARAAVLRQPLQTLRSERAFLRTDRRPRLYVKKVAAAIAAIREGKEIV